FMATEEIIVRAVESGGDRQVAHEVIRRHSVAAATAVKDGAPRNDMLDRLSADPDFNVDLDDLLTLLDSSRFVGRAREQVTEFLDEVVYPLLSRANESPSDEALRV
ncbi:MAG: adenylosuccinate lyase, partial [Gemmatimonadota bacterium]|nr:adenylosuccinate lyase [Gemmatimonadota bacterium]